MSEDNGRTTCPYCPWEGPASWLDIHLVDCPNRPGK